MKSSDDGPPREPGEQRRMDGRQLLRDLAARWRAAPTLEYRSLAVMNHAGEHRVAVRIHARLRRPHFARLVFAGDWPEATRVRVSDGRWIYDRMGRARQSVRTPFRGSILQDIAHPLDETGYSVDQFFAAAPFLPPATWGGPGAQPPAITAVRTTLVVGEPKQRRDVYRVIIARGIMKDTLWLDKSNLAPLQLVRFGPHGGTPQELLKETFTEVRLAPPLSSSLFTWTEGDETGVVR